MKRPWFNVSLLFLAACTVDASVGADRATTSGDAGQDATPPGDSSAGDVASNDGGPPADATIDSPSDSPADTNDGAPLSCGVTLAPQGTWVDLGVVQEVLPQGSGGTITAGTYVLTAIHSYLSGPQGTAQFRETIAVTGSPTVGAYARASESQNTTGQFQSYPPRGDTATFTADSPTMAMFVTPTCPAGNPHYDQYSATSTSLTLLDTTNAVERIYQRVN